jgi:hypothetical protein
MQLTLTIVLVALYLRLTQALIGVFPGGGVVLGWFCGPALMMVATGFLAYLICTFLPRRWENGRPYGAAPRKVHLSWRSAVLLPVMAPWVLFPGNFLWQVRNADWTEIISLKWRIAVVIVLAAILAWTIHKARRDRRLLRDGEIAMAIVHGRDDEEEPHNRVFFQFMATDGTVVSGWGWDFRYQVPVGFDVPVFYDPRNPKHYVVACGSWFEAD